MKTLLTLLALAGVGAAACSSDTTETPPPLKGDASMGTTTPAGSDSGTGGIAAPASRGQQVTNLAAECTANTDCKGAGKVTCLHDLGMLGGSIPGGYCTAECQVDDECGKGGSCPIADISRDPTIVMTLQQFGGGLSLTTLIPSQCYATCDKTAPKPCARSEQTCSSILDMMGTQASVGGFSLVGFIGQYPQAKQTFCFPPVQLPMRDAGVTSVGDAGAALVIRGMDAGI